MHLLAIFFFFFFKSDQLVIFFLEKNVLKKHIFNQNIFWNLCWTILVQNTKSQCASICFYRNKLRSLNLCFAFETEHATDFKNRGRVFAHSFTPHSYPQKSVHPTSGLSHDLQETGRYTSKGLPPISIKICCSLHHLRCCNCSYAALTNRFTCTCRFINQDDLRAVWSNQIAGFTSSCEIEIRF